MNRLLILSTFWLLTGGHLAAQSLSINELIGLVGTVPATFEQKMEDRGFTCYQRSRTLTNWSCLFMNQKPVYLKQPTMAPEVIEYVFNPYTTVILYQSKRIDLYQEWHNQLVSLGFVPEKTETDVGAGHRYRKDRMTAVLRAVDSYNGISNNKTGYGISLTWMRQPPAVTQGNRVKP